LAAHGERERSGALAWCARRIWRDNLWSAINGAVDTELRALAWKFAEEAGLPPGTPAVAARNRPQKLEYEPAGRWRAAALGSHATNHYAVTTTGDVVCWGARTKYTVVGPDDAITPVRVMGLAGPATAVAPGRSHACALLQSGGVQCWGRSDSGQLGASDVRNRMGPVIPGLSATAIASGADFSCALGQGGGVTCWGENGRGELGDGTTTKRAVPTAVLGLSSGVRSLRVYDRTVCAVLARGEAYCWGETPGPLWSPGFLSRKQPTEFDFLKGMVDVSLGRTACGRSANGAVSCTDCYSSETCRRTLDGREMFPLSLGEKAGSLAGGYDSACAVVGDGDVACWGTGHRGTPRAPYDASRAPLRVPGLGKVVELSAGQSSFCARVVDGTVWCWGDRYLGDERGASSEVPVRVVMD
jgi:alpha-tubulin suppressor-like RCC1 family protein